MSKYINDEEECNSYLCGLLEVMSSPPMFTTLRLNTATRSSREVEAMIREEIQKVYSLRNLDPPRIFLHPVLDNVLILENRGPQQIRKMEKEVIVDQNCGMAVLRGADIFVQGILGAPANMLLGDTVSVYADLDGKCLRGNMQPWKGSRFHVGNGVAQMDRDVVFKTKPAPSGVGILMTEPLYEAPCLSDLRPDLIMAQNLPSIMCSYVLDPQPGERILDMCAAPGGKTTHIASKMKNEGEVIAIDRSDNKVDKIKSNLEKWGLTCVSCYACDALKISVGPIGGNVNFPEIPAEYFDRILVDVPCSALGQRPSLKNNISLNSLQSYAGYQRKFIRKAVQLLRPGGVLLYSTCTVTLEENEKQVVWIQDNLPGLSLTAQCPVLGSAGRKCRGLTDEQRQLIQVFDPSRDTPCDKMADYDKDTIGFFIAKFTKIKI
ncbi:tRNA (cytosine(72)-C(5))-methyltransferase NSUN6-like isoform X2 [Ostrea edulis]|uniref:tRNA (cytosine(72)-C(5))-methyltransferase NSUN6-like isoform X2 n=1 Tax=Ostrea edulis TaxID=37623 RepID=UPI0024AE9EB7|nr:tRNA (cytosine(72)-C(5))-methyltransferase NSUN6-like isoform X2 [Ostrea edulis]